MTQKTRFISAVAASGLVFAAVMAFIWKRYGEDAVLLFLVTGIALVALWELVSSARRK